MNGQTDGLTSKRPSLFYTTLSPSGPLPYRLPKGNSWSAIPVALLCIVVNWNGRPERADSRPERTGFWPERANFSPERADSKPERADFRLERADFRPERAWGGDGQTNK